ncbi:signal peptidase I [Legionella sp. W05-934-2]|jgi:signal peptidase I|uniref:signal peptidase I n=1 Tax=Legionella sp. W05-934-2 TaxID=1198649 RepID=UPI0034618353
MSFALFLLVMTILTGVLYVLEVFYYAKKRPAGQKRGRILEFGHGFFPIFLIVLILRSFLGEPFRIPSGSLEPTLQVGDFVVVNKFSYGLRLPVSETKILPISEPKTGQIAVFRWPPDPTYDFIKRVIGVPGDKVEYRDKVLYINGKEIKQTFIEYTTDESSGRTVAKYEEDLAGTKHAIYLNPEAYSADFSLVVPPKQYFMMGDNRDDSADSRFWGFVPESYLRGKAVMVWLSWNGQTGSVRWSRIGTIL